MPDHHNAPIDVRTADSGPAFNLRREWEPLIRVLAFTVGAMMLGTLVMTLFTDRLPGNPVMTSVVALGVLALDSLAFIWLVRDRFPRAVGALVIIMLVVITYSVHLASIAERANTVAMFTLPIALSALLLGRRALAITTVSAITAVALLAVFRTDGPLWPGPGNPFDGGSAAALFSNVLLLVLLATFLNRFTFTLQHNVEDLRIQEQINAQTNLDLQQEIEVRRFAEQARGKALQSEREARALAEQANQRSWFLADLGLLLSAEIDMDSTVQRLPEMLVSRFCDWAALDLLNGENRLERVSVAHSVEEKQPILTRMLERGSQLDRLEGLTSQVLRHGEPVVVRGLNQEMQYALHGDTEYQEMLEQLGYGMALLVPLVSHSEVLGILTLIDRDEHRPFTDEDSRFFAEVGRRAAVAIANARLYSEAVDQNEELERRVSQRTAQLQAANAELEAFTYSASHDLRAPLRGIDGFSQALEEDYGSKLDETALHYIERIRNGARRMGNLIDDLLSLSRLSQGTVSRESVDLSAIASAVLRELQEKEPERNVSWEVEEGLTVVADSRLLTIALENLLGNSWKFTVGKAEGHIWFGTIRQDEEPVFFVRDNGAGFNMDYSMKLFVPFQRLHSNDEFAGTGIGLATVYRIVRRHGGRIWAEGSEGEGASFYFTLPSGSQ